MSDEFNFEGSRYISAQDAASLFGFTRDYIARLARTGKISSRRVGKNWYVDVDAARVFFDTQAVVEIDRKRRLADERRAAYREAQDRIQGGTAKKADATEVLKTASVPEVSQSHLQSVAASEPQSTNLVKTALTRAVANARTHQLTSHQIAPMYVIHPAADFLHKVSALITAFVLVFGSYAFADPRFAIFAQNSASDGFASIRDLATHLKPNGVQEVAAAAVAVDPRVMTAGISDVLDGIARTWNSSVDAFVYTNFFGEQGLAGYGQERASVSLRIVPAATTTKTVVSTATQTTVVAPKTIITNPVVERVREVQKIVTLGGITEEYLQARLDELRTDYMQRILATGNANSTYTSQIYNVVSHTNKIDKLDGVEITNATITGGSVVATSFSGIIDVDNGGTGTSTNPSYGQLLVGDGAGGYSLVSTSSLGIVGGGSGTPGGSDGQVQYNAGGGNFGGDSAFTFDATTNLLSIAFASSTAFSSLDGIFVGRTATTSIFGSATSTFGAGIQTTALNVTSSSATSTFANGIRLAGGCFELPNGQCAGTGSGAGAGFGQTWEITGGALTPTSTIRLALGQASSTIFSAHQAWFGSTATSSFSSAGVLTLAGSLNGPLDARNGIVGATTSIGVLYGGTGLTSAPSNGQILVGNASGGYTLTATSSLGLPTFSDLSSYATFSYLFPNAATTTLLAFSGGLTTTNATATTLFTSNLLSTTAKFGGTASTTVDSSGNTAIGGTLNVTGNTTLAGATSSSFFAPSIHGSTGKFGATATSSFDAAGVLTLSSALAVTSGGTGATSLNDLITLGTHTTGNYVATLSSSGSITVGNSGSETAAVTANLNMGNANTWTALQTFANASTTLLSSSYASSTSAYFGNLSIAALNGPLQANNGVVSATTSIGVLYGGTGRTTAPSYGQVLVGNASGGYDLVATSSLGISGSSLAFEYLFPNAATTTLLAFNGGLTTTNATSTSLFSGALLANGAKFGQTATSSFSSAGVLNLAGISSALLKTDGSGNVVAATAGTDYALPGSTTFGKTWEMLNATTLAPTTSLGILVSASSTIGNGTQAGGLTVSGGATTTGNATFNGQVRVTGSYDENTTLSGVHIGYVSTPRILFANGNASQNFQIDNDNGTFRWYLPGNTRMSLTTTGLGINSGTAPVSALSVSGGANIGSGFISTAAPTNGVIVEGNVGVGTTSPYAKLSVVGQVVGANFVATTSAASIFPYASTTALSATSLCLSTDCRTSWPTAGSSFGQTWELSGGFLAPTSSVRVSLGQASSTIFSSNTLSVGQTATATISSAGVLTLPTALAVTSGGTGATSLNDLITLGTHTTGNYVATLSSSGSITVGNSGSETAAVTANLNMGNANTWTALQTFANASSTLFSSTYASSTNGFFGNLSLGTLNGPLQANNGVISATTSVGVLYGGTGLTSAPTNGQILVGNASGGYTLTATSSLGLPTFSDLSSYATFSYLFPNAATTTLLAFNGGLTTTNATGTDLFGNIVRGNTAKFGQTGTTTIDSAGNVSIAGTLGVSGNTTFAGATSTSFFSPIALSSTAKFGTTATSSFSAAGVLNLAGLTSALLKVDGSGNVVAATAGTDYAAAGFSAFGKTFEITSGALAPTTSLGLLINASSTIYALSTDFSTSTNATSTNLFATNGRFTNAIIGTLNGPLQANNGIVSATTSIQAIYGGTGQTSYAIGDLLYASAAGTLSKLPVGSAGQVLKVTGGLPAWGADITTGGGGGATAWSTTTDSLAIYPTDTSDVLILGSSATATASSILEVFGTSYFSSNLLIGTTSNQTENRLTLGGISASEGGQIALLPGSNFATSWMWDNYEGNLRLLRGNGSGVSTASILEVSSSTGALVSGSITSGFGAIDIGADALTAGAGSLSSLTVSGNTSLANATSSATIFGARIAGNTASFGQTASTTIDSSGNTAVGGTLNVTGNTTLAGATSTSFFSPIALSSTAKFGATATSSFSSAGVLNLAGITSSLLKVDGSGNVVAATAGTDYATPGSSPFGQTWELSGGFLAPTSSVRVSLGQASSTIFSSNTLSVGQTATATISSAGVLTLPTALAVTSGGTGATSLNDLITLGTHTTGNYVATLSSSGSITVGNSGSETAAVTANLNMGNANTWTALQTFANASTTLLSSSYASSTSAYFGNLSIAALNGLLKSTNGVVSTATAGVDYLTSADIFAYPFPSNATTTLLAFNGGLTTTNATGTDLFGNIVRGNTAKFGGTATSSFDAAGILTLAGALNGPLQANNGVVSATTSIGILYGGTGATSASGARTNLGAAASGANTDITSLSGVSLLGNTTIANATSTNFFSGVLLANTAKFGQTASTTIDSSGNTAIGGTLNVTGNTTLAGATSTSFFSPIVFGSTAKFGATATSSFSSAGVLNLAGITSSLLKTDGSNNVVAAVAGTDYATPGTISSFKDWQITSGALAPTTTLGILVSASSTIGNGTQAGGLTISGGATTTLDLVISGGDITLGTQSIFSGGDTASLNNIDAIDATTETTIEAALDTLSNVTTVGALNAGSITSGFGAIDIGADALTAGAGSLSSLTVSGNTSLANATSSATIFGARVAGNTAAFGQTATSSFDATGNLNLASGAAYSINGSSVLSSNTLGSGVLTSSLTTVGALNSGSITSGFGSIDIGADALTAGAGSLASLGVSGNTTLAGATSTSFFSPIALNSTAKFGATATSSFSSAGVLNLAGITSSLLKVDSSGNVVAAAAGDYVSGGRDWNVTSGALAPTTSLGILVNASSTIFALSTTNSTSTNATTTNFAISGITSSLLKTNAGGGVIPAIAGTDYAAAGYSAFGKTFEITSGALAPTTTLGILVTASSTIGNGTQAGGLTISGGATTTGNAYFASDATLAGGTLTFGSGQSDGLVITGTTNSAGKTIQSYGSDPLYINAAGNNVLFGDGSGADPNVGIGTTTPFKKLSVAGDIFANDTITGSNITATGTLSVAGQTTLATSLTGLLKATAGVISTAVAGTDYANFGYLFPSNATTTLLAFNGGLTTTNATGTDLFGTIVRGSTAKFGGTATSSFDATGNLNLASGAAYSINGTSVLSNNTLGTGVLTSSLTTVGALNSGSITSGFGSIDIGADALTAGAGSLASLTVSGNTTLAGATSTSFFSPIALSSTAKFGATATSSFSSAGVLNLAGLSSALLKVDGSGNVVAAASGDYVSGGRDWNVTSGALAPTTTLGILVSASSTIGNGTATGGLTISGGATTTGNLLVQGNATTTNFAITAITSALLKTNGTGGIVAAVAGTDYAAAGYSAFGQTWELSGGFLAPTSSVRVSLGQASSTIFSSNTLSVGQTATATISSAGVLTLPTALAVTSGGTGATSLNDLITLGTHTTGNYVATLSSSGSITVGNSGSETAAVTANLNMGNANTWTALQTFANASSSLLSSNRAWFGGTATTSIDAGGDLTVGGGDIVLGSTSIFSGGDTASLNNIDAIDATTETTIEAALDTLSNVTSLGTLTGLTVSGNTTLANATSSTFFSTNLLSSTAKFGGTASTTIDSSGNTAVGGTLNVTGNTTLAGATSTSFFSPIALSSTAKFGATATSSFSSAGVLNLAGITSSLLKTDGSNNVVAAVDGSDYISSAYKDWNVVSGYLAPTTTLGVIVSASSTIGAGATTTGLTISGGATTTGPLLVQSSLSIGTADVNFVRDAANTIAQRNGTSAQAQNLYNTYTSSSVYERLETAWLSNVATIRTTNSGASARALTIGTAGVASLNFMSGGAIRWVVNDASGGHLIPNVDNGYTFGLASNRISTGYFMTGLFYTRAGVGTSTPWGKLAVNLNNGDTNVTNAFIIASSTASATTTHFVVRNTGEVGIGTTTPGRALSVEGASLLGNSATAGFFVGTTTATSTFAGGIESTALNITSTSATSTFANGIRLSAGCFQLPSGTCAGATDVSSFVSGNGNGSANRVAYWTSASNITSSANLTFDGTTLTAREVAVSHTAPFFTMDDTDTTGSDFRIDTADAGATFNADIAGTAGTAYLAFALDGTEQARFLANGYLGLGSTTPYRRLSVNGDAVFTGGNVLGSTFTATSTSVASTFPFASTTAISSTNASTTNFVISSAGGSGTRCLQVGADGTVSANASACGSGGSSFGQTWEISGGALAPTTTIRVALGQASSTIFSANQAWFGQTATTSIDASGNTAVGGTLSVTGNTTLAGATSTSLFSPAVLGSTAKFGATATSSFSSAGVLNLAGLTSSLLKTDGSNNVVAAVPGSDYISSSYKDWNVVSGALTPTTTIRVSMGLASSTAFSSLDGVFVGRTSTTSILASATSTFAAGIETTALNVTSTSATSTFANGIRLTGGCFQLPSGTCLSSGGSGDITAVGSMTSGDAFADSTADDDWLGLGSGAGRIAFDDQTTDFVNVLGANLGVGTTSPWARLSVEAEAGINSFAIGSTTSTHFMVDSIGNVGIGTSTPFRALSVTRAVATAQQALAYDGTRYTDFLTDSVGDLTLNPQGDDVFLNADNLWVCTGGACPTGSAVGTGNIVAETSLGVGTSTPSGALVGLQAADNSTFLKLTAAGTARADLGTDSSGNLLLYTSNSKDIRVGTTSSPTQLIVKGDSNKVGVGTTTPTTQFSIAEKLYVGGNGATTLGSATSTIQGDLRITGKLDVSTIDPPYTIDGTKYATYVPSMTGVKEETTMTVQLDSYNAVTKKYETVINFDELEEGSDLWLFYQITTFGEKWKDLTVLLTPAFDGQVFYKKDAAKNTLTISGTEEGEVSMRLTAARYDRERWPNLRPDQDGNTEGTHVISSKPKGGEVAMESQTATVATATSAFQSISDFATSTIKFATSTIRALFSWIR